MKVELLYDNWNQQNQPRRLVTAIYDAIVGLGHPSQRRGER